MARHLAAPKKHNDYRSFFQAFFAALLIMAIGYLVLPRYEAEASAPTTEAKVAPYDMHAAFPGLELYKGAGNRHG